MGPDESQVAAVRVARPTGHCEYLEEVRTFLDTLLMRVGFDHGHLNNHTRTTTSDFHPAFHDSKKVGPMLVKLVKESSLDPSD